MDTPPPATDEAPALNAPTNTTRIGATLAETKASTLALAQRLASQDNGVIETLEPAERLAAIRDLLIAFVSRVAAAAKSSVAHVRWLLVAMAVVGVGAALHLWLIRDYAIYIAVLPIVILLVPFVCVLVCYRVLRSVAELPEHIHECADALIAGSKDYWSQIAQLELKGLGLIRKWKTYFLLARILRQAMSTMDDGGQIMARLGLAALAANPLAWAFLAASIIVGILATLAVCALVVVDLAIGLAF